MNERITELALEVFSFKYKTNPNELNPGHHMDHLHKFAELIVRECASYMYEHYPHSHYEINYMRKHMGDADWNKPIEKHFDLEKCFSLGVMFGWFFAHHEISTECEYQKNFYVGSTIYDCEIRK